MITFVPFVSDDEVVAIGHGLVARTLPKSQWTHSAHFAAALWLMADGPDGDAENTLPGLIRAYNEATWTVNSDTSGYHETITQASLRAARAFWLERSPARSPAPLFVICNELMASRLGRSDWVFAHWTRERLFSVEARRGWVEPDLEPLPW
jgi:hypothetical protein